MLPPKPCATACALTFRRPATSNKQIATRDGGSSAFFERISPRDLGNRRATPEVDILAGLSGGENSQGIADVLETKRAPRWKEDHRR